MKTTLNPIRKLRGECTLWFILAIAGACIMAGRGVGQLIHNTLKPEVSPQGQNIQAWGDAFNSALK